MTTITSEFEEMNDYIKQLEEKEQPTCNIENPEECENCGA